jgi:hypothetical protein
MCSRSPLKTTSRRAHHGYSLLRGGLSTLAPSDGRAGGDHQAPRQAKILGADDCNAITACRPNQDLSDVPADSWPGPQHRVQGGAHTVAERATAPLS